MNVIKLKRQMRGYAVEHKIAIPGVNWQSEVWGPAAQVLAYRVSKHKTGKGTASKERLWRMFNQPALNIIPRTYKWARPLVDRNGPPGGVVWHNAAASSCTADQIHSWHLSNGWSGIAYTFFVDKEGRVFRGRPEDKLGGHTLNFSTWLGVCTEGNFDKEYMGPKQLAACIQLRKYLDVKYDRPRHKRHRDMMGNATSCPGQHFPFDKIV
jgi:hypothetical protein